MACENAKCAACEPEKKKACQTIQTMTKIAYIMHLFAGTPITADEALKMALDFLEEKRIEHMKEKEKSKEAANPFHPRSSFGKEMENG